MYNLYGGSKYTSKSFTRDSTPILLVEAVQCSPGLNPTAILLKGISTVLPWIETSHKESNFFASTALTKGGTSCLYYLSLLSALSLYSALCRGYFAPLHPLCRLFLQCSMFTSLTLCARPGSLYNGVDKINLPT